MPPAVTHDQILAAVLDLRGDIKELQGHVEAINGRLRDCEVTDARLAQWAQDKELTFAEIKHELGSLRSRTNIAATLLTLGELILAAVIGLFSK